MTTPILSIAEVTQAQSSKEVTINEMIRSLENATQAIRLATITGNTTVTADQFTDYFYQKLSGTPGAFNFTVPNTQRLFYVLNGTNGIATVRAGAFAVTVAVPVGEGRLLYCDGSDEIIEVGGGGGAGASGTTKISIFLRGDGADENLLYTYVVAEDCELSDDLAECQAYCATPPGAASFDISISLQKNGVEFGQVTFQDSVNTGAFTNNGAAIVTLTAGDRVSFFCPAAFEGMAGISITLLASP